MVYDELHTKVDVRLPRDHSNILLSRFSPFLKELIQVYILNLAINSIAFYLDPNQNICLVTAHNLGKRIIERECKK